LCTHNAFGAGKFVALTNPEYRVAPAPPGAPHNCGVLESSTLHLRQLTCMSFDRIVCDLLHRVGLFKAFDVVLGALSLGSDPDPS
jgi:hypothetical protein